MNQTFSPSRFGRLVRMYFSDSRWILVANLALLSGVLTVLALLIYTSYPAGVEQNRALTFFTLGWAAWYAFIWQQTDLLNHKERSINYLLRPASQREKFLLHCLITGLGFVVIYLFLFTLIDAFGVTYVNNRQWTADDLAQIRRQGGLLKLVPYYASNNFWPPTGVLILTALLHPFALAFLLIIRRYGLPLVAVLAFGLFLVGLFGNQFLVQQFLGVNDVVNLLPFKGMTVRSPDGLNYRNVNIAQPFEQIGYLVSITALVLLYITAYFRLKEREV